MYPPLLQRLDRKDGLCNTSGEFIGCEPQSWVAELQTVAEANWWDEMLHLSPFSV